MITATQLRNSIGLKTNESILQVLSSLENSSDLHYKRGKSTILEPDFFPQYFKSSRKNQIKEVQGKIVSVANNKGGVGKTSLNALTAYKTANMGFKTVAIDTDPQGNLTNYMLGEGFEPEATLYNVLKGDVDINEAIVKINENLFLLPSGLDNEFIHETVSPIALPRTLNSRIFEKIDTSLFLIDTNPSLSDINLAIHSLADMVMEIINNDSMSVKGLMHVLSKLSLLGYTGAVKAVFNKVDGREKLNRAIERIKPLIEEFHFSIAAKFMRTDNEIKNAQYNKSGAIGQMDLNSKCQTDSLAIAIEILTDLSNQQLAAQ